MSKYVLPFQQNVLSPAKATLPVTERDWLSDYGARDFKRLHNRPNRHQENNMRCDQYIGLNDWARQKVSHQQTVREVGARILPNGKVVAFDRTVGVPFASKEVIGKITGAWTDHVANLHRYTFPDGRVYEEFVQCEPWSSGPCYYIALKNQKGNVVRQSLWTDEELC